MSRLNARAAFVPKFQRWGALGSLGCASPLSNESKDSESRGRKIATTKRRRKMMEKVTPSRNIAGERCGLHLSFI